MTKADSMTDKVNRSWRLGYLESLEERELTAADREFMDEQRYNEYRVVFSRSTDASSLSRPLSKEEYLQAMEDAKHHGVQQDPALT